MFELTINDKTYQFRAGFGFLKEINSQISVPVEGLAGVKRNVGLRYTLARILDGDLEALCDALLVMNKGETPRLTRSDLEEYLEDADTDLDQLFRDVKDFFGRANCTRKAMQDVQSVAESQNQAEN